MYAYVYAFSFGQIQDEDIISEIDQGECSFTSSGIDHEKELQRQLSSACHSSQISDVVCYRSLYECLL